MNMFAKFDENPAMTLQDIKETKRYGRTDGRTHGRTDAGTDNVKTVYPTTNKVCGGYNDSIKEKESSERKKTNVFYSIAPHLGRYSSTCSRRLEVNHE